MADTENQGIVAADIVAALERTGFLLEQRAAQELETAGFYVTLNDAFPDLDEGKSRETDILGEIEYPYSSDGYITAVASILVECKNYTNPVTLIGRESSRRRPQVDTSFVTFDPFSLGFSGRRTMPVEFWTNLRLAVPDGQSEIFTGNQIVHLNRKAGKWAAENSSIYDSVQYPLLKARKHEVQRQMEGADAVYEAPAFIYCFPVLLVSGDVYTVAVGKGEPRVAKAKWSILERLFYLDGARTILRTDVVSFPYFSEYIEKRILRTLEVARDAVKKYSNFYDPEWLARQYGGLPQNAETYRKWLSYFRERHSKDSGGSDDHA